VNVAKKSRARSLAIDDSPNVIIAGRKLDRMKMDVYGQKSESLDNENKTGKRSNSALFLFRSKKQS
jgi:hypothetical protein